MADPSPNGLKTEIVVQECSQNVVELKKGALCALFSGSSCKTAFISVQK